ncbi:F-box only protein 4-like [Tubulanus polymorphus]|uniref:F-box only protein 4-like n=1 Tax=Tubulanus polymorphus TaxID=672921 RepID=UPI003DA2D0FD
MSVELETVTVLKSLPDIRINVAEENEISSLTRGFPKTGYYPNCGTVNCHNTNWSSSPVCQSNCASMHDSTDNFLVKYTVTSGVDEHEDEISISRLGIHQSKDQELPAGNITRNTNKMCSSSDIYLHDVHITSLPREVMLHVLRYLNGRDLCVASAVCKQWFDCSNDEWLWQMKLKNDMYHWKIINHRTNPNMYWECASDWTSKEIYLRCCPDTNQQRGHHQEVVGFMNLTSFIRSFLPKTPPRIAMFGPGLESKTSVIAAKIMRDQGEHFLTTGLVPGIAGVGSGVSFKLRNKLDFQLSLLYSMTKKQRENLTIYGDRIKHNHMLKRNEASGDDYKSQLELNTSIQDLCRLVAGFIFVINVETQSADDLSVAHHELFAMVNERWSLQKKPLLILACVREADDKAIPVIDVVKHLKLGKLRRPWQIMNCSLDKLEEICDGFQWVIERCHQP